MIGKLMYSGIALTAIGFSIWSLREKEWKRAVGEFLIAIVFAYLVFKN